MQRLPVSKFSQGGWFPRRAGLGTCTILLLSLMLYLSLGVESAFSQQQLIGTYTVSSPANLAGGCRPDFNNPYQDCPSFPVQMGSPLLITATPGSYSIVITGGSVFIDGIPCYLLPVTEFPCPTDATINLSIWSGDAATGYFAEYIPGSIGCCVNTGFQHKGGNIALYASNQFSSLSGSPALITGSAVVQLFGTVGTPLSITTPSLPNGTVGSAYSQSLAASGGVPPYTWSVSSGALPGGLSLTRQVRRQQYSKRVSGRMHGRSRTKADKETHYK